MSFAYKTEHHLYWLFISFTHLVLLSFCLFIFYLIDLFLCCACGRWKFLDQVCTTAVAWATAVTTPNPEPAEPPGNSSCLFKLICKLFFFKTDYGYCPFDCLKCYKHFHPSYAFLSLCVSFISHFFWFKNYIKMLTKVICAHCRKMAKIKSEPKGQKT